MALAKVSNGQTSDATHLNQYYDLFNGGHVYDAQATFGAKGDGQNLSDGQISSGNNILTSPLGHFVAGDVGKGITVLGAGAAAAALVTTISGYTSATVVTLTANASTTIASGGTFYWGTDDTAAINAALLAAKGDANHPSRGRVFLPYGRYRISGQIVVTDGLTLEGAGKSSFAGTPTYLDCTALAGSATSAIKVVGGSDVMLRNFYIEGRPSGSGHEIEFSGNGRRISIDHVIVHTSTTGDGITLGTGGWVIQSLLRDCTVTGANNGFTLSSGCTSTTLESCFANVVANAGYQIGGTYNALLGCAADGNLNGYSLQNANAITLNSCGAENSIRSAFLLGTGTLSTSLTGCRGVGNNSSANALYPSFLAINDGADGITVNGCTDSSPVGGTVNAVASFSGLPGYNLTLQNNSFTLPVQASIRNAVGGVTVPYVYDVKSYGAKGDVKAAYDGVISGSPAVLTSVNAPFLAADVGKTISVRGAGAAGVTLATTIASYQSATQVTLTANTGTAIALLAVPVNSAFSTASTGGTLVPATYYYRVTAVSNSGGETTASTETSQVVGAGTSTNTVTVNWGAVTGAASYNVYGRTTGAELKIANTTALTYVDTGSITPAGALPSVNSAGTAANWGTNDITAIQNAINAASGNGPVYLPAGFYKITSSLTIPDGTIFEGANKSSSSGLPTRIDATYLTGVAPAISVSGGSDIILRNFYLTGRWAGSGNEIETTNSCRRIAIEHVTVNSLTTGAGFNLGATGYTIQSYVHDCSSVGSGYGFQTGASNTSNTFEGCYGNSCSTAGYLIQGTYIALVGCACDNNSVYGYLVQNANTIGFLGCGAELNNRSGWHMEGALQVTLSACRAVSCNTGASASIPSFVNINNSADYITCIGCTDTLPNAATTYSVGSTVGTPGNNVSLLNCSLAKPVAATIYGPTVPQSGSAWHVRGPNSGSASAIIETNLTSAYALILRRTDLGSSADAKVYNGNSQFTFDSIVNMNADLTMAATRLIKPDVGTVTGAALAATLNKQSGTITTETGLTGAAGSVTTYTVTNSKVAATSQIFVSVYNGTNTTQPVYVTNVTPASGSFTVGIRNGHGSVALNGSLNLQFWVVP